MHILDCHFFMQTLDDVLFNVLDANTYAMVVVPLLVCVELSTSLLAVLLRSVVACLLCGCFVWIMCGLLSVLCAGL